MPQVIEVPEKSDAGILIAAGVAAFLLYEYEKGKSKTTTTTTGHASTVPTAYTGGSGATTTTQGSSTGTSAGTSTTTSSTSSSGGTTTTTASGTAQFSILAIAPVNPIRPGGYIYVNVLIKNVGTATGTAYISGVSTNSSVVEGHFIVSSVTLAPGQSKTVRMRSAGIVATEFASSTGYVYFATDTDLATVAIGAPISSLSNAASA